MKLPLDPRLPASNDVNALKVRLTEIYRELAKSINALHDQIKALEDRVTALEP